jgi:phosphatidylethanolamine/phosphatidyl-N-methylethanolamine N-methyltransferase
VPATELSSFLRALRRSPRQVGAIAPSSPFLAERLTAVVPALDKCTVVELGAGTGAVTGKILQRLNGDSQLIVVERDAKLAELLTSRCPSARVFNDDARNLPGLLSELDVVGVDSIICGLPWSLFTKQERTSLLSTIRRSLKPSGVFTTFAYLHALIFPSARRFHDELGANFEEVLPTRAILRNVPPAITYACRRPRN